MIIFARDLVAQINQNWCLDSHRIHATGYSNGGFLSYELVCRASDLFASIYSVAGVLGVDPASCTPLRPVASMEFHGTDDPVVHFAGGTPVSPWNFGGPITFRSVDTTIQTFRTLNNCLGAGTVVFQNGDTSCTDYSSCDDNADVILCTITGGGYTWPDVGDRDAAPSWIGPTSYDVDADEMGYEFLAAHPMMRNDQKNIWSKVNHGLHGDLGLRVLVAPDAESHEREPDADRDAPADDFSVTVLAGILRVADGRAEKHASHEGGEDAETEAREGEHLPSVRARIDRDADVAARRKRKRVGERDIAANAGRRETGTEDGAPEDRGVARASCTNDTPGNRERAPPVHMHGRVRKELDPGRRIAQMHLHGPGILRLREGRRSASSGCEGEDARDKMCI